MDMDRSLITGRGPQNGRGERASQAGGGGKIFSHAGGGGGLKKFLVSMYWVILFQKVL